MIKRLAALISLLALALIPGAAAADVQDFTISSFVADYYVSRQADGSSHMRVEEQIVAEFPNFDQNHGILRALPKTFDGHSLRLNVTSVTKADGQPWEYSTDTEDGHLVLKIGDADKYVHGRQTYRITYDVSHVMAKAAGYNGLFWNVNGNQWQQPFGQVTARVHLSDELAGALKADTPSCYTGAQGGTQQHCTVATTKQDGETIITFTTTRPLIAGQTLTYNLHFNDGTFAAYKTPLDELLWFWGRLIGLAILPPILAFIFVFRRWYKYGRDPKGRGVIVPEYLQPKEVSVLGASAILNEGFKPQAISATMLDLAVRHYLKIYETKEKKILKDKIDYELELIRFDDSLRPEEAEVIKILFGDNPTVGAKVSLSSLSTKLHSKATTIGHNLNKQLATDGYFRANPTHAGTALIVIGVGLFILGFFVLPYSLGLTVAGLICFVFSFFMPARTAKGVQLRDYLLGLKHYMKLAEADRLKALQSPHGSLTEKVDINDQTQLVKLYEKLLPYAAIFGIEQDWAKQFAHLYTTQPDWYSGSGTFNTAYLATALHGFDTASTASFTPPSSSGSGGSAGGGGGGGGGGGW